MFQKLKNFAPRLGAVALAMGAGLAYLSNHALAAADTDLSSAIASGTSAMTDNKGLVLTFIGAIFVVTLVITLAKRLLGMAKGQVAGAIGGGKRRGR